MSLDLIRDLLTVASPMLVLAAAWTRGGTPVPVAARVSQERLKFVVARRA